MRLHQHVYCVGSGQMGLSHRYDCNVYLVDAGEALVLIDAGTGVASERILENIRAEGLDPARLGWVLLTHFHADHACGAEDFRRGAGCRIAGSAETARRTQDLDTARVLMDQAKRGGVYEADYQYRPARVDTLIEDGQGFSIGRARVTPVSSPGHSRDALSFLIEVGDYRALFVGDTLFADASLGLLNHEDSSLAEFRTTLPRLRRLEFEGLCPGHAYVRVFGGRAVVDAALESLSLLGVPTLGPRVTLV